MTRQATQADIGRIVRFYLNGWRYGRLLEIEKRAVKWTAVIQSPPIKGKRSTRVPLEDVEAPEDIQPKPPAVLLPDSVVPLQSDLFDIKL